MSQTNTGSMHLLHSKLNGYLTSLDKKLSKSYYLNLLEKKTRVPKTYFVTGISGIVFFLIFFNVWGNLLTNLVGFIYPTYATFNAVERGRKEDTTQWLVYWIVFSLFNVIEFFNHLILYWVPFFYTFKAAALLYLALPQTRGASVLYYKIIRPYGIKQEKGLDDAINEIKKSAADTMQEVKAEAEKKEE